MKKTGYIMLLFCMLITLLACNPEPDNLNHSYGEKNSNDISIEIDTVENVIATADEQLKTFSDSLNLNLDSAILSLPEIQSLPVLLLEQRNDYRITEQDEKCFREIVRQCLKVEASNSEIYFIGDERFVSDDVIYTSYERAKENPQWNQSFIDYLTEEKGAEYCFNFFQINNGEIMRRCGDVSAYTSTYMPSLQVEERYYIEQGAEVPNVSYELTSGEVTLSEAIAMAEEYVASLPQTSEYVMPQKVYEVWVCKVDEKYTYRLFLCPSYNDILLDHGHMGYSAIGSSSESLPQYCFSFLYITDKDTIDFMRYSVGYYKVIETGTIENIITLDSALRLASSVLTSNTMFNIDSVVLCIAAYPTSTNDEGYEYEFIGKPFWKITCNNTGIGQYSSLAVFVDAETGEVHTYSGAKVY